ncbi:microfibril-associated glycoprotein 4-like isoform X2 [Drosophila biarmipes]|uniref:microfibril-associated glycoprotein 4-like isoform X2 n=1 Tax=Drosophila biarmipes TaxID=125945 RepID=UPI0007E6E0B8|nr:microfibril-associated glycoprotein 4-like isoform X2 [Drosophila biarmipes]
MNTDKQENGIQIVRHPGIKDFEPVFEDIPSAGPNWMVIQRRIDGWDALNTLNAHWYKEGFGDHESEFWLGCQKLHEVTTSRRHELYVQIVISDGGTAYARYDDFVVGSEDEGYALRSLGAYSGDAGDALSASNVLLVLVGHFRIFITFPPRERRYLVAYMEWNGKAQSQVV